MGGVYGEFLSFFPELFDTYEIYTATPDVESGYTLEPSRTVSAVIQSAGSSFGYGNFDIHFDTHVVLTLKKRYWFWTREELNLLDNEFVLINGKYYRGISQNAFNREGGFWETMIEMVSGNDGTKTETPELADGEW